MKNNNQQPPKLEKTDAIILLVAVVYLLLAFTDIFGEQFKHIAQTYGGWVVLGVCVLIMAIRKMPKK